MHNIELRLKQKTTMKMIKRSLALSLGLVLMGGAASFAQSLADAKKAIDAEQYQKATSMLKTLMNTQGKDGDVYFSLGNVYLLNEELDSAKVTFEKGIAAAPKSSLNFVGLGKLDLFNKNAAAAKANFDKAVELGKKDYRTYVQIGRAYFENPTPDYAAALPYLEKADELETKDRDPEVFIALGDYWAAQKENGKAYQKYLLATDIDPNIKRVKVQVGRMYKMAEAFIESEDEINKAIAMDPNYGPAYRELAENQMIWSFRDGSVTKVKREAALSNMRKYLDLTDKSFDSRYRYVQFLGLFEDWDGLSRELSTITVDPANPKSFVIDRLQGYSAVENKNFELATQKLKSLFAKPENASRIIASDYLFLGRAYQGVGNDSLALINVAKGAELDTLKAEELAVLAQKMYTARKYDLAVEGLKKAISLNATNPNRGSNYYYLGLANFWNYASLLNAQKNPSKDILKDADAAFTKVLEMVPELESAMYYRARVNKTLDDPQAPVGLAVPLYEKFIEFVTVTKPEKAAIRTNITYLIDGYNYLGAYFANTDKEKAMAYLNKTLALDPQNAYATETLKILAAQTAAPKKAPIKK